MKCHWYTEENFFSKKEIKEINTLVNKHHNPNYKDIPADTVKKCTVKITDSVYLKQYVKKLHNKIEEVNTFYFGFDVYDYQDNDWIYHNTYSFKNQGQYNWHIDMMKNDIYDLKYTVLLNVSEKKYTGGEFNIMLGDVFKFDTLNNPGSLIIFPSFLLHKVNPVTSGERKTLVVWKKGKLWQ
jgi:PKHD-type hydroxylase